MEVAVIRAVLLLMSIGYNELPPIKVVDSEPVEHKIFETVAYTDPADPIPTIYLVRNSPQFRAASKKDAKALAGVIAHEFYHIMHGTHQGPAYDEEIRVLLLLGDDYWVHYVRKHKEDFYRFDYPKEHQR